MNDADCPRTGNTPWRTAYATTAKRRRVAYGRCADRFSRVRWTNLIADSACRRIHVQRIQQEMRKFVERLTQCRIVAAFERIATEPGRDIVVDFGRQDRKDVKGAISFQRPTCRRLNNIHHSLEMVSNILCDRYRA